MSSAKGCGTGRGKLHIKKSVGLLRKTSEVKTTDFYNLLNTEVPYAKRKWAEKLGVSTSGYYKCDMTGIADRQLTILGARKLQLCSAKAKPYSNILRPSITESGFRNGWAILARFNS